jgi:hypothetical protein
MRGFYFPVEEAILADWLGVPRPPAARGIRIDHPGALRALQAVFPRALRPRRQGDGAFGPHTLANAAGRIALAAVPQRLAVAAEPPVLGEAPGGVASNEVDLAPIPPRPLFEVDWEAGTSQHFQPEAYTLCELPGFGARAVVAARESVEAYGYRVVAIGWFGAAEPELESAGRVVRAWWLRQAAISGLGRWDAVLSTGLVSEPLAVNWADEVWGPADEVRGRTG